MASEMNIWKRLQGETPKFFKRVFALSVSLSAGAGAILVAPSMITGFVLPDKLTTICQYVVVAGMAAGAVSKTTVNSQPTEYKAPKDDEQQNS